jgi:serine/threonine protein kinase
MQYAGTPTYMAAELFQKRQYNEKVDIFAFGCLLWEIINREVPYDGLDAQDISARVISGDKLKDHALASIDPRLADLVESSRDVDQTRRPTFQMIVEVLEEVL